MEPMDEDRLERRCPRLGGSVTFSYCRTCGDSGGPACWKILDCWWETFDVVAHLRVILPEAEFERITHPAPPKPKITSLLDLIDQIKKRSE
jgi:hypothetical protein